MNKCPECGGPVNEQRDCEPCIKHRVKGLQASRVAVGRTGREVTTPRLTEVDRRYIAKVVLGELRKENK